MLFAIIIFVVCILGCTWVGYPLFLALVTTRPTPRTLARGDACPPENGDARGDACPPENGDARGDACPPVSILIAAHNEETVIAERLRNLEGTDLPQGTEILIGCDGCSDETADLARKWTATLPALQVHDFPLRRGKPAVLKDLVERSSNEVLVFSDANTMFAPDAVRKLLRPFRDPGVGGVCGRLVFVESTGTETSENLYWKLETFLKRREGRIDSCLGANGAIYAIRRELFWSDLPDSTLIDDFVIGMKVREQGKRIVYAPEAVANEDLPETVSGEYARRVRIGAGNYQALGICKRCLLPRYGAFAFAFFWHKAMRWFTPHLMIVLLAASLLLAATAGQGNGGKTAIGMTVLAVQAVFYGAGGIGRLIRGKCPPLLRPLQICDYFLSLQFALLAGFLRHVRRSQRVAWDRTERRPAE